MVVLDDFDEDVDSILMMTPAKQKLARLRASTIEMFQGLQRFVATCLRLWFQRACRGHRRLRRVELCLWVFARATYILRTPK